MILRAVIPESPIPNGGKPIRNPGARGQGRPETFLDGDERSPDELPSYSFTIDDAEPVVAWPIGNTTAERVRFLEEPEEQADRGVTVLYFRSADLVDTTGPAMFEDSENSAAIVLDKEPVAQLADGALVGFHSLNELRTSFPKTRLILLLKSGSEDLVVDAFRGGAKGVFCKSERIQSLRKSILAVYKGQVWANSHQLHLILEALVNASPVRAKNAHNSALLAKREDEVANLIAGGLSNREVAEKLGLSEHTVSNYLFRIYEKLGLSGRVELVLYILKHRQQS